MSEWKRQPFATRLEPSRTRRMLHAIADSVTLGRTLAVCAIVAVVLVTLALVQIGRAW